jgi:predicted  nucleic acid-binding Zn-ribbon protein
VKHFVLTVVNAVGCFVLLGIVVVQWRQNENQRQQFRDLQVRQQATEEARDDANKRVESLSRDLEDLKASLEATRKAAEESTSTGKEHTDELSAAASSRDLAVTERDALRAKIVEWETAMKQRDENIARQNETISGLRKKLDEAIDRLKKAGAR